MSKAIVFYGPSGAGKTTLGDMLKELGVEKLVSDTSRNLRHYDNELDGVSYNFKTRDEFEKRIEKDCLVEYARYGKDQHYYGLSKDEVYTKLANNDLVFAVTEVNGVINLKKTFGDSIIPVFVYTDEQTLRTRLEARGDSLSSINDRLSILKEQDELANIKYADFCIINKEIQSCKDQLKNILSSIK